MKPHSSCRLKAHINATFALALLFVRDTLALGEHFHLYATKQGIYRCVLRAAWMSKADKVTFLPAGAYLYVP
jgi:hypothetical protein